MLTAVLAGATFGATYNLTDEFSSTNNPNGVWSYGSSPTDFTQFVLATSSDLTDWVGENGASIWMNTSTSGSYGVNPGQVSLHPGSKPNPVIVRWIAPSAGTATISGQFFSGDRGTPSIAIFKNLDANAMLWSGFDSGSFDLTTIVAKDDTIDFTVYGDYYYGNTPLDANITLVPEPSGILALLGMAVPFGLAHIRRRNNG